MRAKYKIKLGYGFRGNAFGTSQLHKDQRTYECHRNSFKESQDKCRGKS